MEENILNISYDTMTSYEIADLTGKRHDHILRDCDVLNNNYEQLHLPKIGESLNHRALPNGGVTTDRYFKLTKIQTFDLITGYRTDLRIRVNRRWAELERRQQLDFTDPNNVLMLAQNWKKEYDLRIQYQTQHKIEQEKAKMLAFKVEADKPKVTFAESVSGSDNYILVREFAKVLSKNGFVIGQNRLFNWFRENKYLNNRNEPYQQYVDKGLFKVIERVVGSGEETFTSLTTKITGKGQVYFIHKLKSTYNV